MNKFKNFVKQNSDTGHTQELKNVTKILDIPVGASKLAITNSAIELLNLIAARGPVILEEYYECGILKYNRTGNTKSIDHKLLLEFKGQVAILIDNDLLDEKHIPVDRFEYDETFVGKIMFRPTEKGYQKNEDRHR